MSDASSSSVYTSLLLQSPTRHGFELWLTSTNTKDLNCHNRHFSHIHYQVFISSICDCCSWKVTASNAMQISQCLSRSSLILTNPDLHGVSRGSWWVQALSEQDAKGRGYIVGVVLWGIWYLRRMNSESFLNWCLVAVKTVDSSDKEHSTQFEYNRMDSIGLQLLLVVCLFWKF